ncbi:MAG TPA: hypothetical protein VK211_13130 [Kamptonema sp.]|nr:hypothetical protein [Kamptonema sp.]
MVEIKQARSEQMLQPVKKKKSIFENNDAILKPQNRFPADLKSRIEKELVNWLTEFDYPPYHARLFAQHLCRLAIDKRIEETSPRATNVIFTDKDKVEQVIFECKKLARQLEKEKKIDKTLEELEKLDSQAEGNSL